MEKIGVLLMAYGGPNSLEEVEPYYTDIRGGRKPTPELLAELTARYQRVGGRSPLLEITKAQARALEVALGEGFCVYVGMKHWHPYIAEAVEQLRQAGHRRVVALALAPHYSRWSIGGYDERVLAAMAQSGATFDVVFVESWNDEPLYIRSVAERMQDTHAGFGAVGWDEVYVIFSAHSLPEKILQSDDPYVRELQETCELVAAQLGLGAEGWRFAFQSAGRTADKWLGPDILDALDAVVAEGHRRVMIAPVGFVADHLEILYDIDVECLEKAKALGIEMKRIPSANATPTFVAALKAVVTSNLLEWNRDFD